MKQFNLEFFPTFRKEFAAAVSELEKKYGMTIKLNNITLSRTLKNASSNIEFCLLDDSGLTMTKELQAFQEQASFYGFEQADLGKTFDYQGKTWKITGLNPRKHKFPVLTENARQPSEKMYWTTDVKKLLK